MNKQLRIIFMGTPEFAVAPLKAILESGYEVAAVVTAPDKPAGRGRHLRQSAVKEFALANKIPLCQPLLLKDPAFVEELRSFEANLQVVVAFRMLPEVIWNMPSLGTFNLHASLLPQYRGAAPINWSIINGETKTGLTTFFLTREIDTGNVIYQEEMTISPLDNAGSLHDKLSSAGSQLVLKTIESISQGTFILQKQEDMISSEAELRIAPKIFKTDCILDWKQPALEVHNRIRGLSPFPGAVASLISPQGKSYSVKILRSNVEPDFDKSVLSGTISTDKKNYLSVKCLDGKLEIHDLQMEGKKRLTITEFLRGFPMDDSWKMK
jgi:methionyl-tRNA formyltransferase